MKWCIQIYKNCYCNHSTYKLLSHLRTFLFKCLAGILKNRATLPRIKNIYIQCRHTYNVITIIHNYINELGKQFELWLPPRCIFFCWDIFTCFCKDGLVMAGDLFRINRFMLDKMFHHKPSKFALFLEYKNPHT